MNDKKTVSEYTRNVGQEPRNLPEDHPDLWQWLYRGTKEEREKALDFFGLSEEDVPVVVDGQESLL